MTAAAALKQQMAGRTSGLRFRLSLDPQPDELAAGFEAWADLVTDWTQAMRAIADAIRSHHAKHLATSGAWTGPRFARLSNRRPSYYRRNKEKDWPGRPILTRTGALLAALADKRGVGHAERITETSVAAGIDPTATTVDPTQGKRRVKIIDYARAHQTGYTRTFTRKAGFKRKKAKGYKPEQRIQKYRSKTITVPARPPVRADLSATPGSLGYAVRQILQVQVVAARREALGQKPIDSAARMARLAARSGR